MTGERHVQAGPDPEGKMRTHARGRFLVISALSKPLIDREVMSLFRVLFRARPGLCTVWWALIAINAVLPAGMVVTIGWIIASVLGESPLLPPLFALGAVFVVMNAASALCDAVAANLGMQTAEWAHRELSTACSKPEGLTHLERSDLASDLAAARDFDLGITGAPLLVAIPRIGARLSGVGNGLVMAILLFAFQWWAPFVLAGAWMSTNFLLRKSSRWEDRFSESVKLQKRRVRYDYELLVDAPAAKEIRVFGLADWLGDRFRAGRTALFEASWRERRFRMPDLTPCVILVILANGLVFGALAHAAYAETVSLPWLIIFAQAANATAQLGFDDNYFLRAAAQPMPIIERMLGAMDQPGALAGSGNRPAGAAPVSEIRFRNVAFAYPGSERNAIDGFDLTVPAGTSLALVGHNGAGKTTLVKLLTRLYEPTGGQIEIDGVALREFEVSSWRQRLAVVFQDFIRYHWPLRDNVAPGIADDGLVTAALESAEAANLANLDSVMSPGYAGGVEVSGGQWQRVALARVIARMRQGAGLVILDEPTANLDIRGERQIFDRLLQETRGRTTLLISHRFATVRHADRICVLEKGKIAELGTHDELMARKGLYCEMFLAQAEHFSEKESTPT